MVLKNDVYFFFKKGIERGYLHLLLLRADIVLIMLVIIPNKITAPVKKKLYPGKGKKRSREAIK